jgi:NADH:ubiquinone oxidoreductase subunit 2 (subunit N)
MISEINSHHLPLIKKIALILTLIRIAGIPPFIGFLGKIIII